MNLTELKQKYVIELNTKPSINSQATIKNYTSTFDKFCRENSRIYRLSKFQLKTYLAQIRINYSDSYYNIFGSVLKIIYSDVLNQPQKMNWFKAIPTKQTFHNIISVAEFVEMGKRCNNYKHKLIHVILYSTGIRLSELLNIKLSDIDFVEKRIFIHSAKGGKNRFIQIHILLEKYLLKYLQTWKPKIYLLNGQKKIKYSGSSVQNIIKKISNGKYHPHSYRHTYLTNLIEKENVFAAKAAAGHNSLKSTLGYYHIGKDKLRNMYNPLNELTA